MTWYQMENKIDYLAGSLKLAQGNTLSCDMHFSYGTHCCRLWIHRRRVINCKDTGILESPGLSTLES